ncbi:nuclease-related domain-containing protein [Acinetobacter sp. MB5]|uniref:nuclease-related domain-containing protein n=1 Tax=Acinetobacter sp. MB5 TaxID=2069438 RepID=UPI000DD07842|nr:nuclease-related domain-containing protein [Acinetobacter sp. MB5]
MFLLILFLIIAAIIAVSAFNSSAKTKGKKGEKRVIAHAEKHLDEKKYTVLNNCTFKISDQLTTQIDHIVVSRFGVFVIETKNYQGWIFGAEHQKMWTQKLYKKSYQFQNPLHQNYRHIKTVQHLLDGVVEPEDLHSVVVFVGDSTFKTDMPSNVLHGREWINYVKSFHEEVMSSVKMQRICQTLEKHALERSRKTDSTHVKNLKKFHG